MKRNLVLLLLSLLWLSSASAAALADGSEYFIWLNVYDKVLGSDASGSAPALSSYMQNSDADSYIFVAEASGENGYVLLRQKSSGRYLTASTANTWSVVFKDARGTSNEYKWATREGLNVSLVNKKNTSRRLGVDGAQGSADYVSVYYDKIRGTHAEFSIVPVDGDLTTSRRNFVGEAYTNAIGRQQIDYYQVYNQTVESDADADIHIAAAKQAIAANGKVTLGSLQTWLIFDNVKPSEVISTYLSRIRIGTSAAANGTNCRVAIYLNGAVVIPTRVRTTRLYPLELYSEPNCEGTRTAENAGSYTSLGNKNNTVRSFILRRGYMATVATGTNGSGYSRVYVADHADIVVNELPQALDQRISSVYVREWQYVSKKGWCSTNGTGAITSEMNKVRATWFYTWSADRSSTADAEYIPIRQHLSWPSMSEISSKNATANLSFNEPEHSEQHTSDKCSCGGTISAWTSCTKTPDFGSTGARIGSPAPTDASWLTEYIGHVDDMAYRCDFVAFHAYWGTNEAANAQAWYNQLKAIYNATHRPIWITEWNNGASWTTESWPSDYNDKLEKNRKAIQDIVEMLDTCSFVERYAIYNWDTYYRAMINWDDGNVLPAGQVYRDNHSTFAYNAAVQKVPNWWAPSAKQPSLTVEQASTGKLDFIIENPNTDMTASLTIERLQDDGTWATFYTVADRWRFDNADIELKNISAEGVNLETDRFRVCVTTLLGKTVYSTAQDFGYITNPTIEASSKNAVEGWTLSRDAANGYTKATGDTYFEVWDASAAAINFDYYQDLTDLEDGIYSLSANVFNTTDKVAGAQVNGAVGLYAKSASQLYFAPVTSDCALASDATDISSVGTLTIDNIVVQGGNLRVGVRNLGTMAARWAGADNFLLRKTASLDAADVAHLQDQAAISLYELMPADSDDPLATPRDASRFIVNPDCNRKTSYGWTTKNVDYKTDAEAYDTLATNSYWNIWKSGAYQSTMTQEVNGLPEGTYTFSAVLRAQSTATMRLVASTLSTSREATFVGTNTATSADAQYHQGWQVVTTEPIEVKRGEALTLSLTVDAESTAWWSADHFQLTLVDIPSELTAIDNLCIKEPSAEYKNARNVFDITGRQILQRPLKRGIYIINNKKVAVK